MTLTMISFTCTPKGRTRPPTEGDPVLKRDVISALDKGLDPLVAALETRDDLLVAVTADHSTPSDSTLIHSGEPVPVVLVGPM
jgi:2,3-bisphosphoglycerate-independent phosphoglycerate mutase